MESLNELNQVLADADCLATQTEVDACLDRMATNITKGLGDTMPLILCVMRGGIVTCGSLLPKLTFPLQVDYVHASRYRDKDRGGELEWSVMPQFELKGRVILLVDDILDEGHTLAAIKAHCLEAGAASVKTAVLVDKIHDRRSDRLTKADYTGLYTPDRFLFGAGMDYKGFWRNAPGIYAMPE
ncbi:hypoxanthine-guanine phosphoribosyltransferase [Litorivicinus lipolyticus]|uniref:Hypoxanthine-guanine phosphoribosyltransferase n=1 Tax=Litorivicinus lipolyticus TaxID=418701 RepID=A0A5Q2QFA8_9GAMM|nr:hypoxanthine-guanine phosphoribosyltransferase [Litorivicinus lipolyticus]QGG80687.1 hypoxanthine-guanine phosphoribosyltransferase [Litorivicinus lipolyticus]